MGDVFHWYTVDQYRLWVWGPDNDGLPKWQAVRYGHQRSDGRRLIVTPQTNVPSWVSQERYADLDHGELFQRTFDRHAYSCCSLAMKTKDAYEPEL